MTSERIWSNDNGALVCEKHAGYNLSSAIEHAPKRKSHRTELGTYELLSPDECAELSVAFGGVPLCESCRPAGWWND